MRRKRKSETLLIATALVMIAAVSVALIARLGGSDGVGTESLPGFTEPVLAAGESLLEVEGFIDRHQPDSELMILLDEVQAPIDDPDEVPLLESRQTEGEMTEASTQPTTEKITTTSGTTFREVDIRYYVLSEKGLNFREAPSTNSPSRSKLEYGDAIRVIGLSDEWAKVRLTGYEIGYVARDFISQYPPKTSATTTTTTTTTTSKAAVTTKVPTTTQVPATTAKPSGGSYSPSVSPYKFVLSGSSDAMARANFNILSSNGLINKAGSSSINRHYEEFSDNGDGTITVDGVIFSYIEKYGQRYATHYDGLEVCRQSIRANGGKCWLGHTSPVNHNTGSGIPAQRGIVAVPASETSIYPRGTVVFVRGYGLAVVGDRSNRYFDLCYDAGECGKLTRSNSVSGIYVIARP